MADNETFSFEGQSNISKHLNTWLISLWDEVVQAPEIRVLTNLQEEIEKINLKCENGYANKISSIN